MGKKQSLSAPSVPLNFWRELYAKAKDFQALAPWEWMADTHILGIHNEHGARLISVLGAMKEVFGFASYRGSVGANYLLGLMDGEIDPEGRGAGYGQRALLLDFVPRAELRKEDKAVIKEIGFKPGPGNPQRFPEFYSHEPGLVPWYINEAEARLLLDDLAKLSAFALLLKERPDAYDASPDGEFAFFPERWKEPLTWEQLEWRIVSVVPNAPEPAVTLDRQEVARLKKMPKAAGSVWELSVEYAHMPIGELPRPYYPRLGLVVDGTNAIILSYKLSGPAQTMSQTAADCLSDCLGTVEQRPSIIVVSSPELHSALAGMLKSLGIQSRLVEYLPTSEEARETLGFL